MATLTYRALIRMGDDGLVITIPKAWARFYQLKPGEKVEMIANGELLVRPLRRQQNDKAKSNQASKFYSGH